MINELAGMEPVFDLIIKLYLKLPLRVRQFLESGSRTNSMGPR
jgi:hypothetical protein